MVQLMVLDLHERQRELSAWYTYLLIPEVTEHTSWNLSSEKDLEQLVKTHLENGPDSPIRFESRHRRVRGVVRARHWREANVWCGLDASRSRGEMAGTKRRQVFADQDDCKRAG